ncbi:MAG: hypothetical protein ACK5HE_12430, partial [Bacteroidota bacterium]
IKVFHLFNITLFSEMHISEMTISQIYIFSGLFLNYMYVNLVLVCNEYAQYMRLQRIKHFPILYVLFITN